ncbi:MAG: helix-turn-helix domain-containing protein, partial [Chthoniobacterales bacterium]
PIAVRFRMSQGRHHRESQSDRRQKANAMTDAQAIAELLDSGPFNEAVRAFKAAKIRHALARENGNQCRAARALGIHRNSLNRMLYEMKIPVPTRKKDPQRYIHFPKRQERRA